MNKQPRSVVEILESLRVNQAHLERNLAELRKEKLLLDEVYDSNRTDLHAQISGIDDSPFRDALDRFMLAEERIATNSSSILSSRSEAIQACAKLHTLFSRALTIRQKLARVPRSSDAHPAGILWSHSRPVPRRFGPSAPSSSRVLQDHNHVLTPPSDKPVCGSNLIQTVTTIVHSRLRPLLQVMYNQANMLSNRHEATLALSNFLRRQLHVASTKEAFQMIASYSSAVAPFEIPSTQFIRGLNRLGFPGDTILLASTLDPDHKGSISVTSFTRALYNAQL